MSLPILCYHQVGPVDANGRSLNIEAGRLQKHIQYFKRRGCKFLTARQLGKGTLPSNSVCFTFDDCYQSTVDYGFPILDEEEVKASFYAVAGLVGTSSTWYGASQSPLADWSSLRILQASGHEIGNHSFTHKKLGEMSPDAQYSDLKAAHIELTEHGINVGSACFPYGSMNAGTSQAVGRMGYEVGLAIEKRIATDDDDRKTLPRIVIAYSDSVAGLAYRLYVRPAMRRKLF